MTDQNILERIAELEQQIAQLPQGSIGRKTVNGKEYFYQRWIENRKRKEKYVPADEIEEMKRKIEARKALETELGALRKQASAAAVQQTQQTGHVFQTNVRTGAALRRFGSRIQEV